jgi:hypothetical protein
MTESAKDSLVGTRAPDFFFDVERSKVREFARAVYDDHAGDEIPPVPPTFPMYGVADFERSFLFDVLKLDRKRCLNGGQEYDYARPLRIGDRVRCSARVTEDFWKEGRRGGRMRFVHFEIDMTDAATGEPILRSRALTIVTAAEGE